MYAIAQKEGNGLDKAVEEAKYRMVSLRDPRCNLNLALLATASYLCLSAVARSPATA